MNWLNLMEDINRKEIYEKKLLKIKIRKKLSILSKKSLILMNKVNELKCELLSKCLPVVLAQIKAGNTSENLLNEIRGIIYSLYQEKDVTKQYITI